MYTSKDLLFKKAELDDVMEFKSLKDESWMMTHQKSILNQSDQVVWFESFDKDPHCPKNLILSVYSKLQKAQVLTGHTFPFLTD